jgi:type II secretory pathway pseudopilin PulG
MTKQTRNKNDEHEPVLPAARLRRLHSDFVIGTCFGIRASSFGFCRGFTLVEATLSVVLASVLILSSMYTFGAIGKTRKAALSHQIASGLANQLMAEIVACCYTNPGGSNVFGPESNEITGNRSLFDDVDDYNNRTETPPQTKGGTAMSNLTGWTRSVVVAYINPATMAASGTDLGLKQITVTVTDPTGAKTTLVALRSSNGCFDQKPSQATTYVSWVGVQLQVGSDATTTVYSGASIPCVPAGGD